MIDFNVFLLNWENSDIKSVGFEYTKQTIISEGSRFKWSRTPLILVPSKLPASMSEFSDCSVLVLPIATILNPIAFEVGGSLGPGSC